MCYWIAFNNIYTKIADHDGTIPELKKKKNGTLDFKLKAGKKIVKVNTPTEQIKINCALKKFSIDLKHKLISHESTEYFVYRKPKWVYSQITTDAIGQSLNGVINVGRTINSKCPDWSPINVDLYMEYMSNNQNDSIRDDLAEQILDVLNTIRNNIFHAGKRDDDADDIEVVKNAVSLLSLIVLDFLNEEEIVSFVNKHWTAPLRVDN